RRLVARGYVVDLRLIEVDQRIASKIRGARSYGVDVQIRNFFEQSGDYCYDLVVSNPPYMALNRKLAGDYGIDWHSSVSCGRNLYGCALERCLRLAKHGGIVAFLGPYGWLTNGSSRALRGAVLSSVREVRVDAFSSRRLFPGVNQDVSVQILSGVHE